MRREMKAIAVREERPGDEDAIRAVNAAVFGRSVEAGRAEGPCPSPPVPSSAAETYPPPRVKWKAAPRSTSPSAQTRPPCRSTIRRTSGRPIPEPS